MRKFIYIFCMGVVMNGCSGDLSRTIASSQCRIEYTFENPSLGPVNGKREIIAVVNSGKLVKCLDRRTGKALPSSAGHPGWKALKKVLHGETDSYRIQYGSDRLPKVIEPEIKYGIGSGYRITIHNFDCRPISSS